MSFFCLCRLTRICVLFQLANADGRANVSGLSGGLENPQADVDFFFHTEGLLGAPNSNHPLDSVLTTLRPGQSENSGFGPAISFGRSMADFNSGADNPSVAIIKYARGGTNLHTVGPESA